MLTFKTIKEMSKWSLAQKKLGRKISFVPTMGALHEGHVTLLKEGKSRGDVLVLSIYVNPTQFGPNEDLSKYPRDLEGDLEKAKKVGVDAVFLPSDEVMYPAGYETYVEVEEMTKNLCGASRPGHFRGVTTIVAKLFNIVAPDSAIFGEKDYQQLAVIKKMVKDLNLPVEIVAHPTVREKDGLAMSSRNKYLSENERKAALSISKSLKIAEKLIESGEKDTKKIIFAVEKELKALKVNYAKLVDAEELKDLKIFKRPAVLAIAAFVGRTRLIDNKIWK